MVAEFLQGIKLPIDLNTENTEPTGEFIRQYEVPEMIIVTVPIIKQKRYYPEAVNSVKGSIH